MRDFSTSVEIAATPERVWQVLSEIGRWPEWTLSVLSAERLDSEPLGVGSRVRIRQPKLRPAVWEITRWEPNRRFIWVSRSPGVEVIGGHAIAPAAGGCVVTLRVRFDGFLGGIIGLLTGKLSGRYIALEAAGLKARSEAEG